MINVLSRYTTSYETRNGNTNVISTRSNPKPTNYMTHLSRQGDTFENLASRYLGAPVFFWKIADLNPHVPFPDSIPSGTLIRIPR